MYILDFLIPAIAFLIGRWLLRRFLQGQSGVVGVRNFYINGMRYVGYTLVFGGGGMLVAGVLVIYHLADSIPRHLLILIPSAGTIIGLWIAHRYPDSLIG